MKLAILKNGSQVGRLVGNDFTGPCDDYLVRSEAGSCDYEGELAVRDAEGRSIFGAIDQRFVAANIGGT